MIRFEYVLKQGTRILFVDDDPILREFAQVNLSSPSVVVDLAANGREALSLVEAGDYDVILLDLEMPVLNGFDTLAELRSDARFQHLAVIVQTGREDVEAIDRAFRLGATSFVTKPLNWRLLSYQIRFIIRASRAEADLRSAALRKRA
ncbi:MAG: response regulator [Hyphomonas sp.]